MKYFAFLIYLAAGLASCKAAKNLVIVGGNLEDDNAQIYGKIIDLAGGAGTAVMGIVTAANEDPVSSGVFYTQMFMDYGAADVYWIPVHVDNKEANMDPEVVATIQEMTGFFFGGGDQRRVVEAFYNEGRVESDALAAIRSTYESGAVIGGTSAGAACMPSAVMVTGGDSYDSLLNGAFADGEGAGIDDLTYDPFGGLGFIDDFIVDSHFSERGREGRLVRLVADTRNNSAPYGVSAAFGVDENTALVVTDVGTQSAVGEVLGESGVFFCDLAEAVADTESEQWGVVNVRASYLTEGDRMQLSSANATFASWKTDMQGQETSNKAHISSDIFNGNLDYPLRLAEFPYTAAMLFDAKYSMLTYGLTWELQPRFRVWMVQDILASGFAGTNPRNSREYMSYTNLLVHMEENNDIPTFTTWQERIKQLLIQH